MLLAFLMSLFAFGKEPNFDKCTKAAATFSAEKGLVTIFEDSMELAKGTQAIYVPELSANIAYVMFVCGDDKAIDLDLHVTKDEKILAADTADDATPVLLFIPEETGQYEVRISLYDSLRKKSKYKFIVMATPIAVTRS